MDRETYQKHALRTWNDAPEGVAQICNATLGLVGEAEEYERARSLDEMGDLLYYKAICRIMLEVPTSVQVPKGVDSPLAEAARVAEAVKKHLFHGGEIATVQTALSRLERRLTAERHTHQWTLSEVRSHNIDKLRARYPDGFDT